MDLNNNVLFKMKSEWLWFEIMNFDYFVIFALEIMWGEVSLFDVEINPKIEY